MHLLSYLLPLSFVNIANISTTKVLSILVGTLVEGEMNLYLFNRVKQVEVCRKIMKDFKCDIYVYWYAFS